MPLCRCLLVLEGISTIANKVSPFDQFKTKSKITSDALRPEDDQYCFHEFNEYLSSLNPHKKLLKEVEDGAGVNILPRHPIIHVKDEGGIKRHIIENNAIPTLELVVEFSVELLKFSLPAVIC